jgi:hypothetical protein
LETFESILKLVNLLLINSLFTSVLIIIIVRLLFKSSIDTIYAVKIIKWIILIHCGLATICMLINFIFPYDNQYLNYINRATGPYYWAYIIMLISSSILPFFLLFKKPEKNIYFILLISFLINIGWWFERFVIIVTSLHQDYLPTYNEFNYSKYIPTESIVISCFWSALFLVIGNLWNKNIQKRSEINNELLDNIK